MKKQLLIATLAIAPLAKAQFTQSNEPALLETSNMFVCDSNVSNLGSVTGSSVTWDYSAIGGYPGQTKVVEVVDPATTDNAADFTSSTKAFSIQDFVTSYWTSTNTERHSQGFVFIEPTLGNVVATYETDDEIVMTYPFAYNSSTNDNFSGTLSFELNGIPQSPACTGSGTATVDGEGTLIIGTTTIPNVIRYKITDQTTANIMLFGDVELIRTQYEYYDLANSNMPIFIHANAVIQTVGSTTPMADMSIVLSTVEPTQTAGLKNNQTVNFTVFPNPTKGEITLKGNFSNEASVAVLDQTGRTILSDVKINNGSTINLNTLTTGVYLVEITDNGIKTTKSIVIE